MFVWKKLGLAYDAKAHGHQDWRKNSALTPTPFRLNDGTIRVYAGFRDDAGVSRIGFVDVDADNPTRVLRVSERPALDIGRDGCFDDNGVILGDVVAHADGIYMFYVGFQLVAKAKFLAFTGLALSTDGGETFQRISEAPIIDRTRGQNTIGAVHSAHFDNGVWKLWFARGDDWEIINGRPYPQYHIRYVEARDLLDITRRSEACLMPIAPEYRIGRPRVYRIDGRYVMYCTKGTTGGEYFPTVAYSADGVHWERHDDELGIGLGPEEWDARVLCYPALIQHGDRILMFYNGNDMGVDGFGVAETVGRLEPIAG
ncbi:hypothetical protein L602_002000000330 [Cupriavidus gilardii J11]|uniref:GH43/DUF377 family glycosyl hydrolase n=1 Tax=Cupriavidus gilardii J11 TaxID=936133 RepID=A0A562BMD9_9BURK|nr:hypothetical protein [Cupriavidus gilardii]TWG86428.1 hypothetical protein L602_002000000330 [Cupriavidus gilardii J11]